MDLIVRTEKAIARIAFNVQNLPQFGTAVASYTSHMQPCSISSSLAIRQDQTRRGKCRQACCGDAFSDRCRVSAIDAL